MPATHTTTSFKKKVEDADAAYSAKQKKDDNADESEEEEEGEAEGSGGTVEELEEDLTEEQILERREKARANSVAGGVGLAN